jgi:protein-S-isoprenylcysteine O-methyltransferase Ste14
MHLNRPWALVSVWLERFGLSTVFLYLALRHCLLLTTRNRDEFALIETFPLLEIFRQITWIQLYVLTGFMLLIGRRVTVPPQGVKDLSIPLITTFFYVVYEATPWFPPVLTNYLCPVPWYPVCLATGLFLNLVGFCIAIWASIWLGRSFAIFIEVKKVVTDGAYRYMRHPIYFGYIFLLLGFALANFNLIYFIVLPIHIALVVYRAQLEEKRLAESSVEYREYQKRTGFIFPKLF